MRLSELLPVLERDDWRQVEFSEYPQHFFWYSKDGYLDKLNRPTLEVIEDHENPGTLKIITYTDEPQRIQAEYTPDVSSDSIQLAEQWIANIPLRKPVARSLF